MNAPTTRTKPTLTTAERARAGVFWVSTLIVALEMAAGSLWDLDQIPFVRAVFDHLGYPHFLLDILGPWKLLGAIVLMAPGLPRLKEWAYAGVVFNYTGASASHALAGDSAKNWAGPLVFSGIALASWALRPSSRRLPTPELKPAFDVRQWAVTAGVIGAMLILALLTLPKDVPTF